MSVLLGMIVGAVVTIAVRSATAGVFARPQFARQNYRGRTVATGAGVVLCFAVLTTTATVAVIQVAGVRIDQAAWFALGSTTVAVLGFGLLGLLDDVATDQGVSGFRGHLGELLHGRMSAGGMKLVGGGLVALVVLVPTAAGSLLWLFVGAALVALAANLANLFDRAPGRTTKVLWLCAAGLIAAQVAAPQLTGLAVVVGASIALVGPELAERTMLGDSGANPMGAAAGLGVVLSCSHTVQVIVLIAVAVLNLASERVSFSRVIASTPPLRWLDGLGRDGLGRDGPAPDPPR